MVVMDEEKNSMPERTPAKMALVVRRDLGMRQGKVAAQCSHAAMMFLLDVVQTGRPLSEVEQLWIRTGITKIGLQVADEAELVLVMDAAREAGLAVWPIVDRGHTEFHGVPTLTCCAIGPDVRDKLDSITGGLKLL